jgi:FkbM family methyltransferase
MDVRHSPAVNPDDLPFRHYTLKHRVVSWVSQNLFDGIIYTARHGLIAGMKRKGGLGWLPVRPEATAEHRFWESLDLRGRIIYDIGAFQGLLTLFFATHGKHVVSYEPASRNHRRLIENLQLNNLTNVTVRNIGLGSSRGSASLSYQPLMPGGASMEPSTAESIRRFHYEAEEIRITTLDEDIRENGLPAPDFIKIDVEGLEGEVLRGARETLANRPALFLEMHGETMNEKRRKCAEVVAILEQAGYPEIFHVESSSRITSGNTAVAAQGHLYCPSQVGSFGAISGTSA